MSPRRSVRESAACYQLRIEGHLDDRWSTWFYDLVLTRESDGTTSLTGPVANQAHLHGLLSKVRDLGATLTSVERPLPPLCLDQDRRRDPQ